LHDGNAKALSFDGKVAGLGIDIQFIIRLISKKQDGKVYS
jgi:hypothetical protein